MLSILTAPTYDIWRKLNKKDTSIASINVKENKQRG